MKSKFQELAEARERASELETIIDDLLAAVALSMEANTAVWKVCGKFRAFIEQYVDGAEKVFSTRGTTGTEGIN